MSEHAKMRKITALAPWYGSNRLNAERVGTLLAGCEWVGIPCCGGMCEIPHIRARTILANDLHHGIINLANEVRRDCAALQQSLRSQLFHPDTLAAAQARYFSESYQADTNSVDFSRAMDYFVIAWMTRSGTAGTPAEKSGALALRWDAGGGDSATRYHSAINSLPNWCREFGRCTFSRLDVFEFLDKCKDRPNHGLYLDPPFFGPGTKYAFHGGKSQQDQKTWHIRLAERLQQFKDARIVVRAYDHEFVKTHYPKEVWTWHEFTGRKQTNRDAPEVLLVRN